jgi:PHD/YefM family antitoxin component YafN of YafNO toxin-antitoxin module
MARQLVIVSRQHPDLYVYLRDRFAAEADVEVILDRRLAERRREQAAVSRERRRQDRRSRPDIDAQLRSRSHVIVNFA